MALQCKIYDKANNSSPESPLNGAVGCVSSLLQPILTTDDNTNSTLPRVGNSLE